MQQEAFTMSLLFDFYGELLSPRQREMVGLYYNEDLSLAEIAAELGITRQGVRDGIKNGEALLTHYEDTLGLVARFRRSDDKLRQILSKIAALFPNQPSLAALLAEANALLGSPE